MLNITFSARAKNQHSISTQKPRQKSSMVPGQHQCVKSVLRPSASQLAVQPKITVGAPNDQYEQEADRVADQMMRTPDSHIFSSTDRLLLLNSENPDSKKIQQTDAARTKDLRTTESKNRSIYPASHRQKYNHQGEGLRQTQQISRLIQRQGNFNNEEEDGLIQAKKAGEAAPEVTPSISGHIQSLQGGGQPLSVLERSFFEPRFSANFSDVRVHNNARAASAARSINARAFTTGLDVFFGEGEYSSRTLAGRKLLAHELTHVVQQNGGSNLFSKHNNPGNNSGSSLLMNNSLYSGGAGTLIQREPKERQSFTLKESGVGKLIVSTLGQVTVGTEKNKKPKVDSTKVLEILATSKKFIKVAKIVERKYFSDPKKPSMQLVFHQSEDTGTHFLAGNSPPLMEINVPDLRPLPTVIKSIVHEMVHASRNANDLKRSTKRRGLITRQGMAGIKDESATRKKEKEIMKEIVGSGTWKSYTGGEKIPDIATKKKDVRASFVSGKPQLTYQEYHIVNAAKKNIRAKLNSKIISLAENTVRSLVDTQMIGAVTIGNIESFKLSKKEIEDHRMAAKKPMRKIIGGKGTMQRQSEIELQKNIRNMHNLYVNFYDAIQNIDGGKMTKQSLKYLGVILVEQKMSDEWEGRSEADRKMRNNHLKVLKSLLPKGLKGARL